MPENIPVNPYQAPTDFSQQSDSMGQNPDAQNELNIWSNQAAKFSVVNGLRMVCGGQVFQVLTLSSFVLVHFLWNEGATSRLWTAVHFAVGGGLSTLVTLVGIAFWCGRGSESARGSERSQGRERGRGREHRTLAWITLLLKTLSMVAIMGFLFAYYDRSSPSGLVRLFGASSFAAFFTSQALISLLLRGLCVRLAASRWRVRCELSTMAFAIPASIFSWISVGAGPMRELGADA